MLGADALVDYNAIIAKQFVCLSKAQQLARLASAMEMLCRQQDLTIANGAKNFTNEQKAAMNDMDMRVQAMYVYATSGTSLNALSVDHANEVNRISAVEPKVVANLNTLNSWKTVAKAESGYQTTFRVGGKGDFMATRQDTSLSTVSNITNSTAGKVAIVGAVAIGAFLLYKKFM